MGKRGGLSLSVKMILTTTLLIVIAVVGSGVLDVMNVRRAFDDSTARQIEVFRAGRSTLGEFGTPLFGRAAYQLLIDRGRDVEINTLVKATVGDDTRDGPNGKKDYGLKVAYVLDPNKAMIAYCVENPALDCKAGDAKPPTPIRPGDSLPAVPDHEPVGPAFGQLAVDTWKLALDAWKKSAKGELLVDFELTAGDSRYHVFAIPVFQNQVTVAQILAPTPVQDLLGFVVLGYDLAPIDWFAETAAEQKAAASTRAVIYTGVVGLLFVLIGTVFAILQGLSITRPIKQLAWKADQIARGDLEARVDITSSDEIGFLGENFNFMADQIAILLQQTAEKAAMEQELEVARVIQETLVPTGDPVDCGSLKFAGFYQPAAQTGGDWWTWHALGPDKVLIVIGDVTGHGVPSAMITAVAKGACDVARQVHGDDVTVTRLLEIMNYAIFESAQRRFVMTCFASIIDTKARTITYANAGHNFPYLFRAGDGKGEFGSLMIRGNRLGDDHTSKYESKTTDLVPGDVLIWYTDGIVECENDKKEEYGEKRFRASVRRAAALDAGEMRDAIIGEAAVYFDETPRKDDITMVVGRIH